MFQATQNLLTTFAACSPKGFINIIPTWYQYLPQDGSDTSRACAIRFRFPDDLALVALAVVDIMLRIGAFVAVGFVIYGGIQYVISQGEPDKIAGARTTIINAIVGLVLAMFATAIVNYIGNQLI